MTTRLCPCADLDWRGVDYQLEHHPECKAKPAVNITTEVQVHGSLVSEAEIRKSVREAMWRWQSVSTPAYESISTSEAMHILLNVLKWPKDKRRIKGDTIIAFWCVDNESAFDAIHQLIEIEGSGATLYEDEQGNIVFEK